MCSGESGRVSLLTSKFASDSGPSLSCIDSLTIRVFFSCNFTTVYKTLASIIMVKLVRLAFSMEPVVMYLKIVTGLFWPIRTTLAIACSSMAGFHCGSTICTMFASVRVRLNGG